MGSEETGASEFRFLWRSRGKKKLNARLVANLIHMQRNVSNVELSLTAISAAVIVLKVSFGELAMQIASVVSGGTARRVLDVSVAVGFLTIALAALQIPRYFTETLIYSNQDALRLLSLLGATDRFIARCFERVVLRAMVRATVKGLIVTGAAYLLIAEVMQLWVPVTRTYFLMEVGVALMTIFAFIAVVTVLVRIKVYRLFSNHQY